MIAILIGAVILTIVILVAVIVFAFFAKWLAQENILFTTVREGTAKAIIRGNQFKKFLMAFEGYHLNDPSKPWYQPGEPKWAVLYHKGHDDLYDDRSWFLKKLGLHWIGWPWSDSVYVYAFEWNETYTNEKGEEKVLPRAEATDFIYVADFTYAIITEEAETSDRLPTNELTLVTVAIRNPYRALFSGEDWMRRVTAAINRHARSFVGGKPFAELITSKSSTEFSTPIIELTDKLPDDTPGRLPHGLRGRYGVEIRTADLQTIELSGDMKTKDQEATTKEYIAKQEAEAIKIKGQAEADVIAMKGDKEAAALEQRLQVIKKHGEAGIALAGYDAIQEASRGPGNTIVWANNPLNEIVGAIKKGGSK